MLDLLQLDLALHDRVVAHVSHAFESAVSEEKPFRHAFVHGVFPEDIYARFLQKLPLTSVVERLSRNARSASRPPSRMKMQLTREMLQQLPPDQAKFWWTTCSALCSAQIKEVVYRKMQSGLANRLRTAVGLASELSIVSELVCERDRDQVPPTSVDARTVIGMQFSLAHDSDLLHLGTEFYERSWSPSSWYRRPKGFRIAAAAPFLPNTAFVYAVRNRWPSRFWLGRSMQSTTDQPRFFLLVQWQATKKSDRQETAADSDPATSPNAETTPNLRLHPDSTLAEDPPDVGS